MSLHLQTEKLKSITPSWKPSAARPRRPPPLLPPRGGGGSAGAEPTPGPQVAAQCRRPDPGPTAPSHPAAAPPPSQDPPARGKRRRGQLAVTRTTRPGEGQILLPAQPEIPRSRRSQRPPPRHCGSRRPRHQPPPPPSRGRWRAGAGWKLTWGWRNSNIWGLKRWTSPAQFCIKPSRLPSSTSRRRRLASALPWSQAAPSPSPELRQLRRADSPHLSGNSRVGARYPNSRDDE